MPHGSFPTWEVDFPGAIRVEAAKYGYGGFKNVPKAWAIHTPEEKADDNPLTPYYFHNLTTRNASTHYYVSFLGFVFQMVPEREGAYGNARIGTTEKFSWETAGNLNLQTLSIEIEGYAHNIHKTMPRGSPQWVSLIRLIAHRCRALGFPVERSFGHKQVATNRSDPGALRLDWIVYDVNLLLDSIEEEDNTMTYISTASSPKVYLFDGATKSYINGPMSAVAERANMKRSVMEVTQVELDAIPDASAMICRLDALEKKLDTMPTINLSDEDLQTIAQYVNDNHPNMIPAI